MWIEGCLSAFGKKDHFIGKKKSWYPDIAYTIIIELITCDRFNIISKLAVFIFEFISLKLLTEP